MITTTLNRIREHLPCATGWQKLLAHLGKTKADDEPLPFSVIVESNGLVDALWCCRAEPQHAREWQLFACWFSRQYWHLLTDERSREAVRVAERFAFGEAPYKNLQMAAQAAWDAARDAAQAAARDAAWAAQDAAQAAAQAAARDAVWLAARAAARDAAWAAHAAEFLRLCADPEAWVAEYREKYMGAE